MKVFLDYKLNKSGKSKFLQRLEPALNKIGVTFSSKEKGCDVALAISRWRTKTKLPKVIRVDGVHLKENDKNNWKNERIRKGIKKSDIIIYQSKFAQREVKKHLKLKTKKEYVIYNGANPEDYDIEPIETGYDMNIIASAKWCHRNGERKHKGLKRVVKIFKNLEQEFEDAGFFVLGAVPKKYKTTGRIKFVGYLEEPELRRYLKTADVMYYMADYDWCPNALVEAIVAGAKIKYNEKCEAAAELATLKPSDLYIDKIAEQYKRVFGEAIRA